MTEDHRLIKSAKSARDGNVSEASIPEDVRQMVDEIVDHAIDNNLDVSTEQLMVKAILAEREACAKIAEDLKANPQGIRLVMGELSAQEMRSVKAVLSFVTAAIRRR